MNTKHSFSIITPGVISLGLLSGCAQMEKNEDSIATKQPNILLIMADDVDPLHLSCYGGVIPTPNIDALAQNGLIFHRAYSTAAVCTPSRYATITGRFPGQCSSPEFTDNYSHEDIYSIQFNTPINEESFTLQKMLNNAGYFTGYTGKFHIGDLHFDNATKNQEISDISIKTSPGSQEGREALEKYQKIISNRVKVLTDADFVSSVQWENPEGIILEEVAAHQLEWLTQGAMDFFDTALMQEQPFFLHFNTTALHGPNHFFDLLKDPTFSPGGNLENPYAFHPDRQSIFNRLDSLGLDNDSETVPDHVLHYQNGIIYMDDQVGALIKRLESEGALENTIVIFTADHSTEPGKNTCYEKGIRVPFIVSWPKAIKPDTDSEALVSFVDFMPTFAEAAGYTIDDSLSIAGKSFLPLLLGKNYSRKSIYAEIGYLRSVCTDSFKYIAQRFPDEVIDTLQTSEEPKISHLGNSAGGFASIAMEYHPGYFDADQLYNIKDDPFEQHNLALDLQYQDKLKEMKALLQDYLAQIGYYYPLDDTAYVNLPDYQKAVKNAREVGTSMIPWWNRRLDYPPSANEKFYY